MFIYRVSLRRARWSCWPRRATSWRRTCSQPRRRQPPPTNPTAAAVRSKHSRLADTPPPRPLAATSIYWPGQHRSGRLPNRRYNGYRRCNGCHRRKVRIILIVKVRPSHCPWSPVQSHPQLGPHPSDLRSAHSRSGRPSPCLRPRGHDRRPNRHDHHLPVNRLQRRPPPQTFPCQVCWA